MKFIVNENCIACGMCTDICPEVFEFSDDGLAHAAEADVDASLEPEAVQAMDSCPVDAIEEA